MGHDSRDKEKNSPLIDNCMFGSSSASEHTLLSTKNE